MSQETFKETVKRFDNLLKDYSYVMPNNLSVEEWLEWIKSKREEILLRNI